MDIILTASGTRGDVQPALALAHGLKSAGHRIRLIAGRNFAPWICSHGFECLPLLDMEAMMQSEFGLTWVESDNPLTQLRMMAKLVNENAEELTRPLFDHGRDCDLHISAFPSTEMVEVIAEKYRIPHITLALQPYRSTRSGAATLAPITRRDSLLNLLFGRLGDRLRWTVVRDVVNEMRRREGLPSLSAKESITKVNRIPLVNGYSAHVVPHPLDWTTDSATVGYWFLDETSSWIPPQALSTFLAQTPSPVAIGFGSMSSSNPQAIFDLTCEALHLSGQRGVFLSGWSGLPTRNVPDHVCVVDQAPHAWLFDQVSGVVHHGGAGSTAAGLRSGKPTLIVPHMADQPFWGRRVHHLGVGPKPIPRPKLTAGKLAEGILELVSESPMRRQAEQLGAKIRAENGVARGVEAIERFSTTLKRRSVS